MEFKTNKGCKFFFFFFPSKKGIFKKSPLSKCNFSLTLSHHMTKYGDYSWVSLSYPSFYGWVSCGWGQLTLLCHSMKIRALVEIKGSYHL